MAKRKQIGKNEHSSKLLTIAQGRTLSIKHHSRKPLSKVQNLTLAFASICEERWCVQLFVLMWSPGCAVHAATAVGVSRIASSIAAVAANDVTDDVVSAIFCFRSPRNRRDISIASSI